MNARGSSAYLEGAVRRAVEAVASAPPGDRNATVNREAHSLGGLLAQGLPRGPVEAALVAAAVAAGLSEREARYTVRGALDDGERNPRPLPRGVDSGGRLPSIATPAPQPAPRHTPPADPVHASEAREVWARCVRPGGGGEAARELWFWLESRHLDPFVVAERDLIRALPAGTLPGWCEGWRREGRAVLPVFGTGGELVTLRGRLTLRPSKWPKTMAAKLEGSATARVYACPVAQRMLAGESVPFVVVTEGDPDFLTLASWWPLEERVAVIGVWSGALSSKGVPTAVLARIPAGTDVLLCPHRDESKAGEKMMLEAAAPLTLAGCRVWYLPFVGTRDVNDSLTIGNLEARLKRSKLINGGTP
jgi:hypothetical protein